MPNEPEPTDTTPLDEAERKSDAAWSRAESAVDDLKRLGHEGDPPVEPTDTPGEAI